MIIRLVGQKCEKYFITKARKIVLPVEEFVRLSSLARAAYLAGQDPEYRIIADRRTKLVHYKFYDRM